MTIQNLIDQVNQRRTFAIISHPDAGKTTVTEKMLLLGGAIQLAGTVKGKKTGRMATSDWMKMEQERGISITTSVMQFPYQSYIINLLDTPGHEDFSEDTYRTLTAVDSCLMLIDASKGVEDRTIKLMEVCRLRTTPIFTFINKLDRDVRDQMEVIDEIENVLKIKCAPINWPLGMGRSFKGVYNLLTDTIHLYDATQKNVYHDTEIKQTIKDIHSDQAKILLGENYEAICEEIEFIQSACHAFDLEAYLSGDLTPVFFGTALGNFGLNLLMDYFVKWSPKPQTFTTESRLVQPNDKLFSGFVFKIQANMNPKHRDRIAFLRICSGQYVKGMKMQQVRTGKTVRISDALTFMSNSRENIEEAYAGDIIGLHNHGTIQIGDTFTEGEILNFKGIPHFAPELFRRVHLRDPLKLKQLKKGLQQLSEEGATQLFMPFKNNDLILGAVGLLQFDVVIQRLKDEYGVEASYEPVNIQTVRWVSSKDEHALELFKNKLTDSLAIDGGQHLAYLASSRANLTLVQERHPKIKFYATREL